MSHTHLDRCVVWLGSLSSGPIPPSYFLVENGMSFLEFYGDLLHFPPDFTSLRSRSVIRRGPPSYRTDGDTGVSSFPSLCFSLIPSFVCEVRVLPSYRWPCPLAGNEAPPSEQHGFGTNKIYLNLPPREEGGNIFIDQRLPFSFCPSVHRPTPESLFLYRGVVFNYFYSLCSGSPPLDFYPLLGLTFLKTPLETSQCPGGKVPRRSWITEEVSSGHKVF